SLVVELGGAPGGLLCAWVAFGPPCQGVYWPVFLDGELPEAFTDGDEWTFGLGSRFRQLHAAAMAAEGGMADAVRDQLWRLKARFDLEAEEFCAEGAALKQQGDPAGLQRQARLFMDHCLEQFEQLWDGLMRKGRLAPVQPVAN